MTLGASKPWSRRSRLRTAHATFQKKSPPKPWNQPTGVEAGSLGGRSALSAAGVRSQHSPSIPQVLERLRMAKVPTIVTNYKRQGHYTNQHTTLHKANSERVTGCAGVGNWTLALAGYMAFPDLRTVFGSVKTFGDFFEAWVVSYEQQPQPPAWADYIHEYIMLSLSSPPFAAGLHTTVCSEDSLHATWWSRRGAMLCKTTIRKPCLMLSLLHEEEETEGLPLEGPSAHNGRLWRITKRRAADISKGLTNIPRHSADRYAVTVSWQ